MSKKLNRKKRALAAAGIPELNLRVPDYVRVLPEEMVLEMFIEWKLKNSDKEIIGPLRAFSIEKGFLKVVNRNIDYIWSFPIEQIKRAYMLPCN